MVENLTRHWLGETVPLDATHCVRLFEGTHERYRQYIRPGHEDRHDWPSSLSINRIVTQSVIDEDTEPEPEEADTSYATPPPVDWAAELNTLDGAFCSFSVPDQSFCLSMSREDWENLGRPVTVNVTVEPR